MSPRAQQLRRLFLLGLTLFVVSTLGITAYTLWRLRTDAIHNHLQVAALQARSMEDFLTQSLRVTELTAGNLGAASHDAAALRTLENTLLSTRTIS